MLGFVYVTVFLRKVFFGVIIFFGDHEVVGGTAAY